MGPSTTVTTCWNWTSPKRVSLKLTDNRLCTRSADRATAEDHQLFEAHMRERSSRFPDDPEDFREWQARYRQVLAERLMSGGLPMCVPLDAKVAETKVYSIRPAGGSNINRVRIVGNVMLISLPRGIPKAPVLLALHGHEATWGGTDELAFQPGHADDFVAYFAERGWAVVQPATMKHVNCNRSGGRYKENGPGRHEGTRSCMRSSRIRHGAGSASVVCRRVLIWR